MNDRQKILIVDDKEKNLYALTKVLGKVDADIFRANCGNDALIASLNHEFALAILDVQMPLMNGYELAGHLRNDEKTRGLPIIFLTAVYSDEYHAFKGYEAGAVDFVTKPYRAEILLAKVRIFLQLDHQRRELEKTLELEKAKHHLENILLSMSDAVMVVSKEGFIQTVNEAALSLLGYTPSEIIGKLFAHLLEEPCAISEEKPLSSQEIEDPAYRNKEAIISTKHGEAIPVLISRSAFHDRDNLLLGTVIVAKDIRERIKAEEALKERTKTLNDILEYAGDGICVCHSIPDWPHVRFTHWNPRMTKISGYTMDEINRLGWYQTMYPDPEVQHQAIERMKGDDILAEDWVVTAKGGNKKVLSISTTVLKEDNGRTYVLALMKDISDRKSAEEERLANEKLQGVLETAGAICHELNQPLQVLYGLSELLSIDLDEDSPLCKRINNIKEQIDRIATLTRKFTDITRYQSKLYDSNTKILDLEGTQERRKYKRHLPCSGAALSIESDSLKQIPIIDISKGGLAFYYNDRENQLDEFGLLTLSIPDENFKLEEIPYKIIFCYSKTGPVSSNHNLKIRVGIQFKYLNTKQLKQFKGFFEVN